MYGMHVLQLKARAGCLTRSGQAAEWLSTQTLLVSPAWIITRPAVADPLLPAQSTQA